jgi:hypothetical protein
VSKEDQPIGRGEFVRVPSLANLYFLWTNYVSYIVYCLAKDFVTRPVRYSLITSSTAALLNELRLRTGRDPEFPDASERNALYWSYFGGSHFRGSLSDGSLFHRLTFELRRNAAAVAEQGGSGNDLLLTAFRTSASRVAQFIRKFTEGGAHEAFINTYRRLANVAHFSGRILFQGDIAAVFGIKGPNTSKPFLEALDRDLYLLLEQITKDVPYLQPIAADRFAAAAYVASSGRLTIKALTSLRAADFDLNVLRTDKDGLDDALEPAYAWRSSLRNLDNISHFPDSKRKLPCM